MNGGGRGRATCMCMAAACARGSGCETGEHGKPTRDAETGSRGGSGASLSRGRRGPKSRRRARERMSERLILGRNGRRAEGSSQVSLMILVRASEGCGRALLKSEDRRGKATMRMKRPSQSQNLGGWGRGANVGLPQCRSTCSAGVDMPRPYPVARLRA